jgi:hypothetical protein
MFRLRICAFVLAAATAHLFAEEPKTADQKPPEEIVKAGILQFYERMQSDDAKVREQEFDDVMPDEKVIKRLFGDDSDLLWPRLTFVLKEMRSRTAKMKMESERQGNIKSIEVIDVRKDDASGSYKRVLEMIPKDIPVYRAVIKHEKGTIGASAYVVIDGHMRLIRSLDKLPTLIDDLKKAKN